MDLYENRSENNLKGDPSNDTTENPPLFSLVNTFNVRLTLKLVFNVNIVYGNLKSEDSQDRLCPETSTKLYVHEFSFWSFMCVLLLVFVL
jgi:hypothetical protein